MTRPDAELEICGTRWRREDENRFEGVLDESWHQGRSLFGGIVAAALGRCQQTVVADPTRLPRTLNVQFTAPAPAGPCTVHADVLRSGRYVTQTAARLVRDGRTLAVAFASFGAGRPHVLHHRSDRFPDVPQPKQVPVSPKHDGQPVFADKLEFRFCIGAPPLSGSDHPEVGGWCRTIEPWPADLALVCILLDAWPPPALTMLRRPVPGASIDLTYHFLAPLPLQSATSDDHYLFRDRSPTIADGYAEQLGELWSRDGRLIARVRQLSAIF